MVDQLPVAASGTEPYTVWLLGPGAPNLRVGKIRLDPSGSAIVSRDFDRDLKGYHRVTVRNAKGNVILSGTLGTRAGLESPGP